jgi:hypothetical protein
MDIVWSVIHRPISADMFLGRHFGWLESLGEDNSNAVDWVERDSLSWDICIELAA